MKLIGKIRRKIKKIICLLFKNEKKALRKKILEDYKYLINNGVETELGYVVLGGKPLIMKHPNSRIIIGKGVTLFSESDYNPAGINHPIILATKAENAVIELKDGCGMSGTSIVCVKNIQIGYNSMLGVNTNVYDTDFHPVHPIERRNQKRILEALSAPVIIGNDVWIGANSTILKGVVIGNDSIVGANSLVNKNIGENELHAGTPAKFIKHII